MANGALSADAVGGRALRRSPAARVAGESGRTVGRGVCRAWIGDFLATSSDGRQLVLLSRDVLLLPLAMTDLNLVGSTRENPRSKSTQLRCKTKSPAFLPAVTLPVP